MSGEVIATQLGITRAAIWRAIKELRVQGHEIKSSTRIGYRLSLESDILTNEGLRSVLDELDAPPTPLHVHQVVGSTNREAKMLSLEGASHGTVVIAGSQTEGRGRNGRSFYSPQDSGFYLSMLLRPEVDATTALRVTCAAAVAVCRAIEQNSTSPPRIKWVNDIHLNGKKVCGILTEGITSLESGRIESIIVGIGVNHFPPREGFPGELSDIAGSVFADSGQPTVSRSALAAAIIVHLRSLADNLENTSFMDEYRDRSMVIGRKVSVIHGSESKDALVLGITDEGALHVRFADDSERLLQSGEISLRPEAGSSW